QAEDGIRDGHVTGVQTCALPISCLHVGCIPTKALLFNAEIWDHLKEAKEFGIDGVDARKLNWAAIQERKSKIVAKHAKGLEFLRSEERRVGKECKAGRTK